MVSVDGDAALTARNDRLEGLVHDLRNQLSGVLLAIDSVICVLSDDEKERDQICPANVAEVVEAVVEDHAALSERLDTILEAWVAFRTQVDIHLLFDQHPELEVLAAAIEPFMDASPAPPEEAALVGDGLRDAGASPAVALVEDRLTKQNRELAEGIIRSYEEAAFPSTTDRGGPS